MKPIPLSLYIHFPWCVKKCPYCDFNSHELKTDPSHESVNTQLDASLEHDYVDALLSDLQSELPLIWGRPIESIFLGGGTPSLFSANAMDTLFSGLRQLLPIRPGIEITLEANPGTFEQHRFRDYRKVGINRLSIGIQSFDGNQLKRLGRIHGTQEALSAVQIARDAGFDNINLDLMFALPQQSTDQAMNDLQQALQFKPEHLSWYQLTIEKNTLFHHKPPPLPEDDHVAEMQHAGQAILEQQGYRQYEVSAYARQAKQGKSHHCRHNLNYWQFGDYLGIGAGAHGKITQPNDIIQRHAKYRHPTEYMQAAQKLAPRQSSKTLTPQDIAFEFMLNALRLKQGFDAALFEHRTRLDFSVLKEPLSQAVEKGLLELKNGTYQTTDTGWRFLNDTMALFLE